jgi:hypothetical protein
MREGAPQAGCDAFVFRRLGAIVVGRHHPVMISTRQRGGSPSVFDSDDLFPSAAGSDRAT